MAVWEEEMKQTAGGPSLNGKTYKGHFSESITVWMSLVWNDSNSLAKLPHSS